PRRRTRRGLAAATASPSTRAGEDQRVRPARPRRGARVGPYSTTLPAIPTKPSTDDRRPEIVRARRPSFGVLAILWTAFGGPGQSRVRSHSDDRQLVSVISTHQGERNGRHNQ